MPSAQVRNQAMQALNGADLDDVENKNWGAEWYDSTGMVGFNSGSGAFTLNLDTERINSAPEVFVMASDVLTILEAGLYLFSIQCMVSQNGTTNVATNHVVLQEDPDTGVFASLPHAASFFSMPNLISVATGNVVTLVQVGINYRYRVRLNQLYGSSNVNTVPDGSKLTVVRLFKNG